YFFSFEQFRQKNINTTLPDTVPLPAYRAGDFSNLITTENRLACVAATANPNNVSNGCADATGKSVPYLDPLGRTIQSGTIFDPSTERLVGSQPVRDIFVNNKIPQTAAYLDPVAQKILALVPLPLGPKATQAGANYLTGFDQSRISNIP